MTYPDYTHATTTPLTPVAFVNGGNPMIYSDNPEEVYSSSISYIYGFSLPTSNYYDVEFYSNVRNGGSGRAGIVVKNTGGSTAIITYKGAYQFITRTSLDYLTVTDCTNVLQNAFNATTQTAYLGAGQTMFIPNATFSYSGSDVGYKLCYGHYSIKASQSGVYARTFVAPSGTSAATIMNQFSMTPCDGDHQFCGVVNYTQKILSSTFDAQVGTAFLIGEWNRDDWDLGRVHNVNEYSYAAPKSGGQPVLAGNYGVIYSLNFTNAANKFVKLIPIKGASQARFLFSLNNGPWTPTATLSAADIQNNGCVTALLGTSNNANLRIVIPGSNNGNVKVEVCQQ